MRKYINYFFGGWGVGVGGGGGWRVGGGGGGSLGKLAKLSN